MGTDDLFHKRKAKQARELARRKVRRAPYAKILIICEGEKTEPYYFNSLKDHYGLNSANVEICGECGAAPSSIYRYARQRYREEKDAGDPFDRVFCVFDKDAHDSYENTVQNIMRATPQRTFLAITSVPCFEYWLLLHFKYTTKPYNALPNNSAGHQVLAELRDYRSDYQKGHKGIFEALIDHLEFAKHNAERALQTAEKNHTDNPSTRVHELVAFLQHIKEPR